VVAIEFRPVPDVSAVIVSYADPEATAAAVESLSAQTVRPAEIVVVDNDPAGRVPALPGATVAHTGANLGYTAGANFGVARTRSDWLLLLNPDAVAEVDCIERLLEAADDTTGIVGAQVLLADGRVNAGDNPLHLTGISWSGRYGEPAESGPPRSVAVASGAALLVRRHAWDAVGGLADHFFMYHDDVDLAWRARLAGWDVRLAPNARVRHDYDFDKGREKWFLLERNRAITVLCNYDRRTMMLLAPLLLGAEAAVLVRALREGWAREKLRAWWAVLRERRYIARRRSEVQAIRAVHDVEILRQMTGTFDTPLAAPGVAGRLGRGMERYRILLLRHLG
jgi:GT2 family glycosyltransferase